MSLIQIDNKVKYLRDIDARPRLIKGEIAYVFEYYVGVEFIKACFYEAFESVGIVI
jgi:hypothetical protein